MAKLGEDVTEVLDYVPGHFQVIRHVSRITLFDGLSIAEFDARPASPSRLL
jgi:transposase